MKVNNFSELIKYIREKILSPQFNDLQITIGAEYISFSIYDSFDVTIEISKEKLYDSALSNIGEDYLVKFKPEMTRRDMTPYELEETSKICNFLDENLDIVLDMLS